MSGSRVQRVHIELSRVQTWLFAVPLHAHDDPAADAKDGILARDSGHFEALFATGAEAFADAAGQLLRTCLPELRFRISIDGEQRTKSQVHLSTELPVLTPCEWTGHGLASAIVEQGDERPAVSLDVAQRHEAARRTEDSTAVDVASLLSDKTKLKSLTRPQELKELVGNVSTPEWGDGATFVRAHLRAWIAAANSGP